MRKLTLFGAALVACGCNLMPWDADSACMKETFTPISMGERCGQEVEEALEELFFSDGPPATLEPALGLGDHLGEVVAVEPKRVELEVGEERASLRWPRPLPVDVEPGEELLVQVDEQSVTVFFEQGALAFHGGAAGALPRPGEQRIGSSKARWQTGCTESLFGTTFDLLVDDHRIAPGEEATVRGWRVENLGAAFDADGCGPVEGSPYRSAWIAETSEARYECVNYKTSAPACSEAIVAANEAGERHSFRMGEIGEGRKVVRDVRPDGFNLGVDVRWPGPLPIQIEEGELVEVAHLGTWIVFQFPRGNLAVHREPFNFTFAPPVTTPDGAAQLRRNIDCELDGGRYAPSIGTEAGDAFAFPGESLTVGGWTLRLLYAWEIGGAECRKGEEILFVSEGSSQSVIVAHQVLDASTQN